jgi:uncharacterized protein YkvS
MYLIKTYTKSEHEITDEQELKLRTMSQGDKIYLKDGSTLMVNNIAEIVKVKEDNEYKQLEAPERVVFSKAQYVRALSEIIRGFKKYFGYRTLPQRSQTILNHLEYKLEKAQLVKEDIKFNHPLKSFYNEF